jgi:ribosomal small subunit protein bTHX
MGKGDKKTRRGKIVMKSYGVRRPQRTKKVILPAVPPAPAVKPEPKPEKVKKVKPPKEEIVLTEVSTEIKAEKPKTPRTRKKPATPKDELPPPEEEAKAE